MIWNISSQTGIQEEEVFKALSRSFEIRRFHPWCWVKSLWLSSDSNIAKWPVPLGLRTQSIKPESFSLQTMVQSLPGSWCRVVFPAIPWRNLAWEWHLQTDFIHTLTFSPYPCLHAKAGGAKPFPGKSWHPREPQHSEPKHSSTVAVAHQGHLLPLFLKSLWKHFPDRNMIFLCAHKPLCCTLTIYRVPSRVTYRVPSWAKPWGSSAKCMNITCLVCLAWKLSWPRILLSACLAPSMDLHLAGIVTILLIINNNMGLNRAP